MATYSPLANVIISLATASFERDGFGIPMFIAPHRHFKERVIAVTKDSYQTALPVGSDSYNAAQTAFAQPNGLSQLLIGRVEADLTLSLPVIPVQNEAFSVTFVDTDNDEVTLDYTETGATPTKEDVLSSIAGLVNADASLSGHMVATVVGTGDTATLDITTVAASDTFVLKAKSSNIDEGYTATETVDVAYQAISIANDSAYFVTSSMKDLVSIEALATAVNAQDKQYWFTVSDQEVLGTLSDPVASGDILGAVKSNSQDRVVGGYSQTAVTAFPELAAIAFRATFPAGSITFSNSKTSGVPAAANTTDTALLTLTQKQNLLDKNSYFWDTQGGLTFVNSDVKTMSGERPENIRGRDNMVVDIKAAVSELLINQPTGKIPYNNQGVAMIVSVVDDVLQTYVQRGFIEANYKIEFPDTRLIAAGIKASQKLDGITFTAQLTGAITMVDSIRGTLQLDEVLA